MSEYYKQYEDYSVLNSELAIYRDKRTKARNYIVRIRMKDGKYLLRSTGIGEDEEGNPLRPSGRSGFSITYIGRRIDFSLIEYLVAVVI